MEQNYRKQNQTPYELQQSTEIEKWEKRKPSVVSEFVGVTLKPLIWAVNKAVPAKVVEGAITIAYKTAEFLTDKNDIIRDAQVIEISELKHKDLELSDRLANEVHNWALGVAALEGGGTGMSGLPGMAVDIPTLITMSFRVIHKIGACYGYEATTEEYKNYVLNIFSLASSNTMHEKEAAILILQRASTIIAKNTWKNIAKKAAANPHSIEAGIMAIKAVSKEFSKNITKRKALQAIPYVGAAVGAAMNVSFINDIAWAARRTFQKRWLIDNEKIVVVED